MSNDPRIRKLKTKITALLKKAAGTDNEHEAAVFLAKAKELMEEHQITSAQLGDDPFSTMASSEFAPGSPAALKYELESWVARYFGCHPVQINSWDPQKGDRAHMDLNGPESALATHSLMFPYIWKDVLKKSREALPEPLRGDKGRVRKMSRSVVHALILRIDRLISERETPEKVAEGPTHQALIVLGTGLQEYVKGRYSNLQDGRPKTFRFPKTAEKLANSIGLDHQVGQGDSLKIGRG